MEGVETGRHLHRLYLVHRLTRRIDDTSKLQWRATVCVSVLTDEVLSLLRIDERSGDRMSARLNDVVVVEAIGSEQLLHLSVRLWCDLVYHRPGERHLSLVVEIVNELFAHYTLTEPLISVLHDSTLHDVTVVRAVVHALQRHRQFACEKTHVEQDADLAHSQLGVHAAMQVVVIDGVALLGYRERDHLQARVAEDLY